MQIIQQIYQLIHCLIIKPAHSLKYQQMRYASQFQTRDPYGSSSVRRRSETQPIQNNVNYRNKYGYESSIIPRKLVQHSTFLPSINKSQKTQRRYHDRWRSQGQIYQTSNTIDTESETMEYLNQCQRIIQNLKKLTTISSKKVSRIRNSLPSSDYSRYNSDVQRQPSFFGTRQDDLELSRIKSKKNDKNGNKIASSRYAKILQQSPDQSSRNSHQQSKIIKNNNLNQQKPKGKLSSLSNQSISLQSRTNKKSKENPQSDIKNKQKYQNNSTHPVNQFDQIDQKNHQQSQNAAIQLKHLQEAKMVQEKAQQQLRKAQKKQKFLMKYLNKARQSGLQLKNKIKDKKFKNQQRNTTASTASIKQKAKPKDQNLKTVEKMNDQEKQDHQQVTKQNKQDDQTQPILNENSKQKQDIANHNNNAQDNKIEQINEDKCKKQNMQKQMKSQQQREDKSKDLQIQQKKEK